MLKGSKAQRLKGTKAQRLKGSKAQRLKGPKAQRLKERRADTPVCDSCQGREQVSVREIHGNGVLDLKAIYSETLVRCAPDILVREHVDASMPRNVVAIGKCAGGLLDGVASVIGIESAFVAIPEGYRLPRAKAEVHVGGHPHMTRASFDAGRALLRYVDAHRDILFLISGGGSACVEVPLPAFHEDE